MLRPGQLSTGGGGGGLGVLSCVQELCCCSHWTSSWVPVLPKAPRKQRGGGASGEPAEIVVRTGTPPTRGQQPAPRGEVQSQCPREMPGACKLGRGRCWGRLSKSCGLIKDPSPSDPSEVDASAGTRAEVGGASSPAPKELQIQTRKALSLAILLRLSWRGPGSSQDGVLPASRVRPCSEP